MNTEFFFDRLSRYPDLFDVVRRVFERKGCCQKLIRCESPGNMQCLDGGVLHCKNSKRFLIFQNEKSYALSGAPSQWKPEGIAALYSASGDIPIPRLEFKMPRRPGGKVAKPGRRSPQKHKYLRRIAQKRFSWLKGWQFCSLGSSLIKTRRCRKKALAQYLFSSLVWQLIVARLRNRIDCGAQLGRCAPFYIRISL